MFLVTGWAVLLLPVAGLLALDPSGGPDDHAIKYLVLAAGAFFCVACSLEGKRIAWTNVSLALWAFVIVRGVMLLRSPLPPRSLRAWLLLVSLALVHHAAAAATTRRWLLRRAPVVLGTAGAVAGLIALVQWLNHVPQNYSTFANRNFAGAGLAMLLPYALSVRRTRWRAILAGACGLGLLATRSGGGALAAALALAVYVAWRLPRARWALLAGLPALVLLLALALGKSPTAEVRLVWYRAALQMGLDHPVLGLGAEGFAREYPPVRPEREWSMHQGRAVHAVHDDYLESFAEGGSLGLGAHLFLLVAAAWALKRQRAALASLAAFALASVVDLPLQDPSLLALALFPLAFARRQSLRSPPAALAATLLALLAIGFSFATGLAHWRADRALGRFFVTADRTQLDLALALEPRHADALIERSRPEDLDLLLAMEPHHAGAHYNRTRDFGPQDAIRALEEILARHDPHHRLTRRRLRHLRDMEAERRAREAEPLIATDPLRAASLLDAIVREKPGSPGPYLILARLYRSTGPADTVDRWLREAEARGSTEEIADERLSFEFQELAKGGVNLPGIARAAAMLSVTGLRERIDRHLATAAATEEADTPPQLRPEEGEDPAAFAQRLMKEKVLWRAALQKRTMPDCVVARVLAEELVAREPSAEHLRLAARAVRGQGEVERAAQLEAMALFLETLAALAAGDEALASRQYERALRAYPGLAEEKTVKEA
ncbi:MAG: O-antigen ligase family protein, partial [Planctomycetota bacterium]